MRGALPAVLAQIAEGISLKVALELVAAYGGTSLFIKKRPAKGDAYVKLIGMDAARQLVEILGSGEIEIPNLAGPRRRRLIAQLDDEGLTAPAIARRLGVTTRTVRNHRAKNRTAHNEPDLFSLLDD